jgi:thiol-disulfide isomerase/thioredoxin
MLKWLIIYTALLLSGSASAQRTLRLSDTFPVFEMQTLGGETYNNDSTLQYPTIYLFWASWSLPSLELMDEIKQHYNVINPTRRGVRQIYIDVVDVSIDTKTDLHRIAVKRESLPWEQHLIDYKGWESSVLNALGITKIPTLIIVDKNKKVIVIDPDINQLRNTLSNIKLNTSLSN